MSYTDKEMQVSTQIAYMNITQDQINEYLKDHNGEYPTIQEILRQYRIISTYKQNHPAKC